MNIDIATLLLGGTQEKPKAGALADKGFSLELDDRLASLAQLFPGIEPQMLAAALPAGLLAQEVADMPELEGEMIAVQQGLTDTLIGVTLDDGEGGESPQWQLQQLVARSVTGADAAARPAAGKAAAGEMSESAGERGRATELLAVGEKSAPVNPLAAPSPAAVQASAAVPSVEAAATATVEITTTPSASAVAMPAAVRTGLSHAPQQVVTVNHPPDAPEWKQSVSQHIAIFSRNGLHSAEIRLNPEELGSLHISLRMQQDQAQIHIVSEHGHVRQMMEQAMPQLRAAMAESGIQLGQANVSAEGQQAASGEQGGNAQGERQLESEGEEGPVEQEIVPTLLTTAPGNIYGINTFA
ncbi:flagellar hook-length control protein FliK [Enterobacter sp. KBR-315C3_2022]|uniref:flagellar hook-length control protein FliK n=1 Tax=Enterobacter sp. KBR-315C3_2022 TaxID=3242494 RepID=UPI003528B663